MIPKIEATTGPAPTKKHCRRCPRCSEPLKTVYVHGHTQCVNCDCIIDDCCQGETCQAEGV